METDVKLDRTEMSNAMRYLQDCCNSVKCCHNCPIFNKTELKCPMEGPFPYEWNLKDYV